MKHRFVPSLRAMWAWPQHFVWVSKFLVLFWDVTCLRRCTVRHLLSAPTHLCLAANLSGHYHGTASTIQTEQTSETFQSPCIIQGNSNSLSSLSNYKILGHRFMPLPAPDTKAHLHCQPALSEELTATHLYQSQQEQFPCLGTFSREQSVHSPCLSHVLGNVCLETSHHILLQVSCFIVSDCVLPGTSCYKEERRWLCFMLAVSPPWKLWRNLPQLSS